MLDVETLHPLKLETADIALWRSMAQAEPAFASPLLGPDFAQAVGRVRGDTRVAVVRRQGEVIGFLPFHRRPGSMARAVGSTLSDYQALVSGPNPELDIAAVLRAAELVTFRYTGLIDPYGVFASTDARSMSKDAYVIAPQGDIAAYLESVRVDSPKKIKNYRRLDHKLEREVGTIRLVAHDPSRLAFDQLIAWKREQLGRTGVHDFLRPDWTRQLLIDLFERQTGDFRGLMVNLYVGDQLVAGHFGVRMGGVFHPWIASTNPTFNAWSPGQIFFLRAIAAMPDLGLTHYDLGPGHDHYKRAYGLSRVQVDDGVAIASGMAGRVASSVETAWAMAGAHGAGPVGRLRRRVDSIASVELTLGGRMRGMVEAVASQAQRRSKAAVDA